MISRLSFLQFPEYLLQGLLPDSLFRFSSNYYVAATRLLISYVSFIFQVLDKIADTVIGFRKFILLIQFC